MHLFQQVSQKTSKTYCYHVEHNCYISLNVFHVLQFDRWGLLSMDMAALAQFCVLPKTSSAEYKNRTTFIKPRIFWEFGAARFKLNLTFVQLFNQFVSTKNKNLYSSYNVLKDKIYAVFRAKERTGLPKKYKLSRKSKFTIEETNHKQTRSSGFFSAAVKKQVFLIH